MLAGWLAAVAGWLNGCAAAWLRWAGWQHRLTGLLARVAGWLGWLGGWAGCTGWTVRAGWLLGNSFGPCLAHLGFGLILGDTFGPCWALGLGPFESILGDALAPLASSIWARAYQAYLFGSGSNGPILR